MNDFTYMYGSDGAAVGRLLALFGMWYLVALAIGVLSIIAYWKIYTKAGEEGWAAIVPFYNLYVLYKITWGNGWYFLLTLLAIFSWIPYIGPLFALAVFVIHIITLVKLAKAFGKGGGFACGLIFLNTIFIMILGFSNDIRYHGVGGRGFTPPPAGGYQNPYQAPYQGNDPYSQAYSQNQGYNAGYQPPQPQQYTQASQQNPNYHYQRSEPVAPVQPEPQVAPQPAAQAEPTAAPQPEPAAAPQATSTAFCPACGVKVEDGARFCAVCGKQL